MSEVSKSDWQKIACGHPALRHEVLQTLPGAANRAIPLRTFLLEDDQGLAAAAICEAVTTDVVHNPLDQTLYGRAGRVARMMGLATAPVLVFESPLGSAPSVLVREGQSRARYLEQLLCGIEDYAAQNQFSLAFAGIPEHDRDMLAWFENHRYLKSEVAATARLEVQWNSFDGYLEHLRGRSKNALKAVRAERKRNRNSGMSIKNLPPMTPVDSIYTLARQHYRQRNGTDLLDAPEFLPQLQQGIGADLLCFAAEREGQPVASMAVVRFGTVGWVAWLGFAQRDRPNDFTYQNLVYYHLAECAPKLGIKTLLYGTSVLKAKQIRGCEITINNLYFKPRNAAARVLFLPFLSAHRAWYRRKMQ